MSAEHNRLLELLRSNGGGPIRSSELRTQGIATPSQVVYELQLAGHNIQRVYGPREAAGRKLLGYRLRAAPGPQPGTARP